MPDVDDWALPAALTVAILLLLAGARARAARDRARAESRLAALERKVDAVLDHLGVVVPEPRHPQVERLLAEGRQIAAVKAYREVTGADLLTAKRAVDELAQRPAR
jgi:ribosomal protein L7/L12